MFLKVAEFLKRSRPLGVPHKAIVKDNADPDQLGRVKVDIVGLFDGIDLVKRPWIYPWYGFGLGSGTDKVSTFMVPALDHEVVVVFPYDDIYFGFYSGRWDSIPNRAFDSFGDDYPNVYGFTDTVGNQLKVNLATKEISVVHNTGTSVVIDTNGTVTINSVKNVQITGTEKIDIDAPLVEINDGKGVITEDSYDPFTRNYHNYGSSKVKAGH